jgi:hypothetical protein
MKIAATPRYAINSLDQIIELTQIPPLSVD